MSTETSRQMTASGETNWQAMLAAGVLIAILGVLAIVFPFVTGVSLSLLLGAVLVVGAIVHVAQAFSAGSWGGALWQILLGVVYAIAGIFLMANPIVGLVTLTILVITYLVVDGVVEIVMGFQARPAPGAWWVVASGAISLLLAGLLWVGLPATALWAVGLLFGVNLLVTGVSMMRVARGGQRASRETTGEAEQVQQV